MAWVRRTIDASTAPPGNTLSHPVADHLFPLLPPNTVTVTGTDRARLRSRQQAADRAFEAEYHELLSDSEYLTAPNRLYNPASASTVRFLEHHRDIQRNAAQELDPMANQDNSRNYLSDPWADDDDDQRRTRRRIPPMRMHTLGGPQSGRGSSRLNISAPEDEGDDVDSVRAMWHRRPQQTFSPSAPSHPFMNSPGHLSPVLRPPEYADDSRRPKRRKLDSDRIAPSFKGFRYGRYGQVEPGELTMEIVSCDGGLFANESSYAYENILKNDPTVYCTKSSKCNIVLRHQGATVFSLKELVIKAPGSCNYSSPVREGMIFVSMNQDDLLTRTTQYQIQYAPPRSGRTRDLRALAPIISIRHNDDGTTVTRTRLRTRPLHNYSDDEEDNQSTAQMPPDFATDPPPFNITTECDEEESDEPMTNMFYRRPPNRIGSLPFESDSSDEGNPFAQDEYGLVDAWSPAARRRDTQNMTLAEAANAHQQAAHEASAGGSDLMVPHAKFFIEKDKSKCTIRFDPPVSGRFILLKMWSPHRESSSNIDIQAVIAKGFAGPRYFPSVELR